MNKNLLSFMAEAIRYSVENPSTVGNFEIVRLSEEPCPWKEFNITISPGCEAHQWLLSIDWMEYGTKTAQYKSFSGLGIDTWTQVIDFLITCFKMMNNDMELLHEYYFGWSDDTLNRINSTIDELNALKSFGQ